MIISHYNLNTIKHISTSYWFRYWHTLYSWNQNGPIISLSWIFYSTYKFYSQDKDYKDGGNMVYSNGNIHHWLKEYTKVFMGIDYMAIENAC